MGPAQPWHNKMGKLICSAYVSQVRTRCGTAFAPRIQSPSPDVRAPQKKRFPSFHPWQHVNPPQTWHPILDLRGTFFTDICALLQVGSKEEGRSLKSWEEEKQLWQPTSQPQISWLWGLLDPSLHTVLYLKIRHTWQTWPLSNTDRQRNTSTGLS